MEEVSAAAEGREPAPGSTDYTRFVILSDARTGSHMLAQALNSSPQITCFREVLNGLLDFIQYGVEGYDDHSSRDMALREEDPVRFLRERIFCQHPEETRAVGFKLHYAHILGFSGILEHLLEDAEIRVLHLRRRGLLRMLVSLKIVKATGVWAEDRKFTLANTLTPGNAPKAVRHPVKAAVILWKLVQPLKRRRRPRRARVTLTADECWAFFNQVQWSVAHFDYIFRGHPRLTVVYEDLLQRRDEVFDQTQAFLGVQPGPLTVTLRRQNPQPLPMLVENYEELYEVFRGTPYEVYFD